MRLRDYFFLLLVFSAIALGGSAFYGALTNAYGVHPTKSISNSLNTVNTIQNESQALENQLINTDITGIAFIDLPFTVVKGTYTLMKMTLVSVPQLWFAFLSDIGAMIGVPAWAISIVMVFVILGVVYEIIGVIQKYRT